MARHRQIIEDLFGPRNIARIQQLNRLETFRRLQNAINALAQGGDQGRKRAILGGDLRHKAILSLSQLRRETIKLSLIGIGRVRICGFQGHDPGLQGVDLMLLGTQLVIDDLFVRSVLDRFRIDELRTRLMRLRALLGCCLHSPGLRRLRKDRTRYRHPPKDQHRSQTQYPH